MERFFLTNCINSEKNADVFYLIKQCDIHTFPKKLRHVSNEEGTARFRRISKRRRNSRCTAVIDSLCRAKLLFAPYWVLVTMLGTPDSNSSLPTTLARIRGEYCPSRKVLLCARPCIIIPGSSVVFTSTRTAETCYLVINGSEPQ